MGLTYSRQTSPEEIQQLFQRLWPVECGYELERCQDYLMPKEIDPLEVVFSPGVGPTSTFEYTYAEQGIECYLADASVDGPALEHEKFHFQKKFIGEELSDQYISLEDWILNNYPDGNGGVLQMDIEAGEYEAILGTSRSTLEKFKVIVIEVHKLNILTSSEGMALGKAFFDRLLKSFNVCHFHVNNYLRPIRYKGLVYPSDIELTLIRKDLCRGDQPVTNLPHPMDEPSCPRKKDPQFYEGFREGVIRG